MTATEVPTDGPIMCVADGCTNVALFDRPEGWVCFVHDTADAAPDGEGYPADDAGPAFQVDVVAGLAAMILDHTAMTMTGAPDAADAAMRSLHEASAMPLDFAAGVLLATSTLVAAGEVTDEQITALSERFEAQAEGEAVLADPDGPIRSAEPCEYCGDDDHASLEHQALYPLPTDGEDTEKENINHGDE